MRGACRGEGLSFSTEAALVDLAVPPTIAAKGADPAKLATANVGQTHAPDGPAPPIAHVSWAAVCVCMRGVMAS
jgi:hypothetical protein